MQELFVKDIIENPLEEGCMLLVSVQQNQGGRERYVGELVWDGNYGAFFISSNVSRISLSEILEREENGILRIDQSRPYSDEDKRLVLELF